MPIIDRIVSLRRREHDATVALIEALVECHCTKAHIDAGYSSVFQLLVEPLCYSKAAASRRFAAMRCASRCPFVIEMLRGHRTSLTALARIAPVLDDVDDADALLRSIDGLGPEQIEATVAAMRPVPKPVERVRAVAAVPRTTRSTTAVGTLWGSSARNPEPGVDRDDRKCFTAELPRVTISSTQAPTPGVALTFTLTAEAHTAFESARAKLGRTRHRPLTLEETVNALVKHFHAHERSRRTTKRTSSTHRSRHIPRSTREAVFERDGHRCTFVAPDGTRCTATHDLQIDHVVPFAHGGSNDAMNLRTLCGAHNRRLGEVEFDLVLCADDRTTGIR